MIDDRTSRDAILLVDDSPADLELTVCQFRKHDVTNPIVVVQTGLDALDYLFGTGAFAARDATVLPLVMMLDLRLPVIDGIDVLSRVRADLRTKALPVVVLSGSLEEGDVIKTHALHAGNFLQKPFTFDAFVGALGKLGLLRRLHHSMVAVTSFVAPMGEEMAGFA